MIRVRMLANAVDVGVVSIARTRLIECLRVLIQRAPMLSDQRFGADRLYYAAMARLAECACSRRRGRQSGCGDDEV